MAEEIELKLTLPAAAQRALLRHPLLRKASARKERRLANTYYDTPTLALRRHGVALRVRRIGRQRWQTVKCAGTRAGALAIRPEWETPFAGRFDFAAIDDAALRTWLSRPQVAGRLAPLFTTDFRRTAWQLDLPVGARVEVAFDRGWIVADGQRQTICEVEIELLAGSPAAVFDCARALAERVPLLPATASKAERGYRLAARAPASPVRMNLPSLAATVSPPAALRDSALACCDALLGNLANARETADPETIHQARIAARRLHATLTLFRPCLPDATRARLRAALDELMRPFGAVRDADVLADEIVAPVARSGPADAGLTALAARLEIQRQAARAEALRTLNEQGSGALLLEILAALSGIEPKVGGGRTAGKALPDFLSKRLKKLRRGVLTSAARVKDDAPATLHALRIAVKRLRYALECCTALDQAGLLRRRSAKLAALQETLGALHDLTRAGAPLCDLAGMAPGLQEAVARIGAWHKPRYRKALATLGRRLARLGKLRLPPLAAGRKAS